MFQIVFYLSLKDNTCEKKKKYKNFYLAPFSRLDGYSGSFYSKSSCCTFPNRISGSSYQALIRQTAMNASGKQGVQCLAQGHTDAHFQPPAIRWEPPCNHDNFNAHTSMRGNSRSLKKVKDRNANLTNVGLLIIF